MTNRPSPDRAISIMEKAADANYNDPLRKGSMIEFADKGNLMVTGDLHGNMDNLRKIVEISDLPKNPDRHLILQEVVHGMDEEPDGSCKSYQLFELAALMKVSYKSQVHVLLGNHDLAELLGLTIAKSGRILNDAFAQGVQQAYGDRAKEVLGAYKDFIASMPFAATTKHGVFIAHSTPSEKHMEKVTLDYLKSAHMESELEKDSPVYHLIWGRDMSQETADAFAEQVQANVLLISHQRCQNGYMIPNTRHVIIDSADANGCYVSFPLDDALPQSKMIHSIKRING